MVAPLRAAFKSKINYGFAVTSELLAPLLHGWSSVKAPGAVCPPTEWRKALLIGANHIGDILYRTCALELLAKKFPQCEWHIIAQPPAEEVLMGNPAIGKVHRFGIPKSSRDSEFWDLARESYDAAICYDTGMYLRPMLLAVQLGIPNRVGYTHKGFSGLVTHPASIHYPQPYPAYFYEMVSQIADCDHGEPDLRPRVYPNQADRAAAIEFASSHFVSSVDRVFVCFATTRQPTTKWPNEYYAQVVARAESLGFRVVLCGAESDRNILTEIQVLSGVSCIINAGCLSLRALGVFLSSCEVVITPDSGPRHLANSVRTQVYFFRNLDSDQIETGKYCETETDLCNVYEHSVGKIQNIKEITPAFVNSQIFDKMFNS